MYKGLDIITNKVTSEERISIPHHLIDFLSPLKDTYDVTQFTGQAVSVVSAVTVCHVQLV